MPTTAKPISTKFLRIWAAGSFSITATLTFRGCELFMPSLTRTRGVSGVPRKGGNSGPLIAGWSGLVGAAEDLCDVGAEEDGHGDPAEPDQSDAHQQLRDFVVVVFLRLVHEPINAQRTANGSPSFGGSGRGVLLLVGERPLSGAQLH